MTLIDPGALGVPCGAANRFLDALAQLDTEPHAVILLRQGRTAFEGYWAPYGPGVIHGDQSLTKTVTGIALGAAMEAGLLHLEERLVDIFPEYAPLTAGKPYWDDLRVRHIASMGAGMETQPPVNLPGWIPGFFQQEILHPPGSAFFYNSIACSMVGACVRKRSGQGLMDFLTPRVFDKLGIDARRLLWHRHADGLENGSGGLVSTVRDNALFMELYRQGGLWQGERLLSRAWVDFALRAQNPHGGGQAQYGGMLWVRKGCFAADGAMGQWSLLFPAQDAVLAIQQTIASPEADAQVRQAVHALMDALTAGETPWTQAERRRFQARLDALALPRPPYRENRDALAELDGRTLEITQGTARFFADDLAIFNSAYAAPVERIRFDARNGDLLLTVQARGRQARCLAALRGYRPVWDVPPIGPNPARTASVTGAFTDRHTLRLEIRYLESCRVHMLTIAWDAGGAQLTTRRLPVGGFDVPPEYAQARWIKGGSLHAQNL